MVVIPDWSIVDLAGTALGPVKDAVSMPDLMTTILICAVLVEPVLVVLVAPLVTRRLTENNAVKIFVERILPLVRTQVDQAITSARPAAASVEEEAKQRLELAEAMVTSMQPTVEQTIQDAIAQHASNAAKVMSERGVDARMSFAAREEEVLAAVAEHDKGGLVVLAALEQFKGVAPGTYKFLIRSGPAGVPAFLEKHGDKLRLGIGKTAPKRNYIGGGR